MKDKILLHVCCAPCSTHVIEVLMQKFHVILLFANSNIYPKLEFDRRLENARKIASIYRLDIFVENYDHKDWLDTIKGYEDEPEKGKRCALCFAYNLKKTAEFAEKQGIRYFTTTLTISPHKDSGLIFEIGKSLETPSLMFVAEDFKKKDGFRHSTQLACKHELYRQNYCGCEFSIRN